MNGPNIGIKRTYDWRKREWDKAKAARLLGISRPPSIEN